MYLLNVYNLTNNDRKDCLRKRIMLGKKIVYPCVCQFEKEKCSHFASLIVKVTTRVQFPVWKINDDEKHLTHACVDNHVSVCRVLPSLTTGYPALPWVPFALLEIRLEQIILGMFASTTALSLWHVFPSVTSPAWSSG